MTKDSVREFNRRLHDEERAAGRTHLLSDPVQLQIEVTNRCNLRCPICARPYFDASLNVPGDLHLDILDKIDPFLWTAEEVVIGGYGEPLLSKHFTTVLKRCLDRGPITSVITNGTLVTEQMADFLVEAGLDRLVFSLDGVTDETLFRLRGIKLADVSAGIVALTNAKRRKGSAKPELQINFTANTVNVSEIVDLLCFASRHDARQVNVAHQKIYTCSQKGWSLLAEPTIHEPLFQQAEKAASQLGLYLKLPGLLSQPQTCFQPFEMLFIRWNGEVMGCCSAIFRGNQHRFSLGHLDDCSIRFLWNCDSIKAYRMALFYGDHDFPPSCRNCAFRFRNLESHQRPLDLNQRHKPN